MILNVNLRDGDRRRGEQRDYFAELVEMTG